MLYKHRFRAPRLTGAAFQCSVWTMRTGVSILSTMMRRVLPALALYALVLQAFLAGAAPAAAFNPEAAPLCAELARGDHAPDTDTTHVDCVCLAQCLSQASLTPAPAPTLALDTRLAQRMVHARQADTPAPHHPLERGPGARAPPV